MLSQASFYSRDRVPLKPAVYLVVTKYMDSIEGFHATGYMIMTSYMITVIIKNTV